MNGTSNGFDARMCGRNLVVIDANQLLAAGISSLCHKMGLQVLATESEWAHVDRTANLITSTDLFLVGLPLPSDTPETVIRELKRIAPSSRVVFLAEGTHTDQLRDALRHGADGILLSNVSSQVLMESLKLILLGQKVFPFSLVQSAPENLPVQPQNAAFTGLSQREVEILKLLMNGDSNKHIARRLAIAEATVKVHLKSILRKTRAENRTQAAVWALNKGLRPVDGYRK